MKWTVSVGFAMMLLAIAVYIIANLMEWSDILAFLLAGIGLSQLDKPLILRRNEKE